MTKRVVILLASAIGLVVSGCASTPSSVPSSPAATVARPELSELFVDRIDGSTATVPLMRATLRLLRGTDDGLQFNRTIEAYNNLIDGTKDIIFVTPPSRGELAAARKAGVELEVIPLVKDALVFLANKANPVDGLTSRQVKDIYRGKTTNWSQVGGPDKPIIPYQRQVNSGSQTLFLQLAMGNRKPMTAPTGYYIDEMETLVDYVAAYDNSDQALGYSVFYFTQEMYVKDSVKLLAIDGVAPSPDTIADGSYPYLSNYFAVIRHSEPADSPARQLVDWCRSDEGQKTFSAASYVPMEPRNLVPPVSGYGYQGSTPQNTTQSSGTGGPAGWKVPYVDTTACDRSCVGIDDAGNLTTANLSKYPQAKATVDAWLSEITQGSMLIPRAHAFSWRIRDLLYVSVRFAGDAHLALVRLADGHRMALSDFFYDGVNYIDFINRTLLNEASNQQLAHTGAQRIGPFTGLPADTLDFSMDSMSRLGLRLEFYFPPGNPFLANMYNRDYGMSIPLNLPFDLSPYGYLWQTTRVLVDGRAIDHVVSNFSSVNPQDAKINAAIDAWVAKQYGKGQTLVEVSYTFLDSGFIPVVDVTWIPQRGSTTSVAFDWNTCEQLK